MSKWNIDGPIVEKARTAVILLFVDIGICYVTLRS
jgi:hypothetical protein